MNNRLDKLLSVKSIVTISMTLVLCAMMLLRAEPPAPLMELFRTVYVAVITYFFAKKEGGDTQ